MKKTCVFILLATIFFLNGFGQKIKASYSSTIFNGPFTGKVIAYFSKENKSPKDAWPGLENFPCFSVDVKNVQPGQSVIFDDQAVSYPTILSNIERSEYYVQIVWDRNLGDRSIGHSAGNLYNTTERIDIDHNRKKVFKLVATKMIAESEPFQETQFVKEIKVPSALLSNFHHKSVSLNAAVILPKEYYEQPNRKFPVVYQVYGFGGNYRRNSGDTSASKPLDYIPVIRIWLDGNCPLGHSVYANSDNNGPWGDALTTEFIPALEKQYRSNGARLLTGHSSGGWTVLWLQTHYPTIFAGCWSSSPDPVDFRNFQNVNLYEDNNMYYNKDGALRPVATVAGWFPWVTMKTFYQMENVIYRGEQVHSFDAVFSKKGIDGNTERIINSSTGEINKAVFEHWKKYDISFYLRNNWDKLKPVLDKKIRITVGTKDNFLLNYSVMLLETEMKKLNANMRFDYYPGDHFTVKTPEFQKDGNQFLEQKYLEWLAADPNDNK